MDKNYGDMTILTKIKKVEMAIKRLKNNGFLTTEYEKKLRDILITNKVKVNKFCDQAYLKAHFELSLLLNHLMRLEKISEYYNCTKFSLNTNDEVKLFLDVFASSFLIATNNF